MRHLLDFDGLFVDYQSLKKKPCDYKQENNSMVQQVIENMMNTEAISHLTSQEQDEYLQKSLKIIQELSDSSSKVEPLEVKDFKCIDLYAIRVLSLMICRGTSKEKAIYLANLITLNQEEDSTISWDNERL